MDVKTKAELAWKAILAVLLMDKDAGVTDIHMHLLLTPKPHIIAVQFILLGSGRATEELEPDGDFGAETTKSLRKLHEIAHMKIQSENQQ